MLDMRFKNLARDLIRPVKKEGINTRNLDYLKLVFKPKDKSVLFATFPASGANWTDDIIGYVLARTFKGESGIDHDKNAETLKSGTQVAYKFIAPADSRALSMKTIGQNFPELALDHMFHTHDAWKKSGLWWLDDAQTMMITRHIPTALYSYSSKRRDIYGSFEECLEKTGLLDRAIRFYNSWHAYQKKNPDRFFTFKYEDCRQNPQKTFSGVLNRVFNYDFDSDIVAEAIDFFDFEKQKKRESDFNKDENKHFHYKGKTSYRDEMKPETYQNILVRLNNELTSSFGYDYAAELQENERLAS